MLVVTACSAAGAGQQHGVNRLVTVCWQLMQRKVLRRCKQMDSEHADSDRLNEMSGAIIGCAFTVLNTLGAGFLEKVYENALALTA